MFKSVVSLLRQSLSTVAIAGFLFSLAAIVNAQSPLVFRDSDGRCASGPEICGDGIDQDCSGSDLPCLGLDQDRDGFTQTQDCNDLDRKIYPGVTIACAVGDKPGTKSCPNQS